MLLQGGYLSRAHECHADAAMIIQITTSGNADGGDAKRVRCRQLYRGPSRVVWLERSAETVRHDACQQHGATTMHA